MRKHSMKVTLTAIKADVAAIPIVCCLVFSMHKGKLTGPHDGFGIADWDLQRMWASERAVIMRNQGFIHPATLVSDELEYNKGYERRMAELNKRFKNVQETVEAKKQ